MKVTTESGSEYVFQAGVCIKNKRHAFKVWSLKVVDPDTGYTWKDVWALPDVEQPEVGKRMYVSGKEDWYLTSPVVSVGDSDE